MTKPNHINLICKMKNAELSSLPLGSVDAHTEQPSLNAHLEFTPFIY